MSTICEIHFGLAALIALVGIGYGLYLDRKGNNLGIALFKVSAVMAPILFFLSVMGMLFSKKVGNDLPFLVADILFIYLFLRHPTTERYPIDHP